MHMYVHTYTKIYLCINLLDKCTPLYVASAEGFNDVVKSLIAANAYVNCICKVSYILVTCTYVAM